MRRIHSTNTEDEEGMVGIRTQKERKKGTPTKGNMNLKENRKTE